MNNVPFRNKFKPRRQQPNSFGLPLVKPPTVEIPKPAVKTVEITSPPQIQTTETKTYLKIGNKYLHIIKIAYLENINDVVRIYFTGQSKEMGYVEIYDKIEMQSISKYMKENAIELKGETK